MKSFTLLTLICITATVLVLPDQFCQGEEPDKKPNVQLADYLAKHGSFAQPGGDYTISAKKVAKNELHDIVIVVKKDSKRMTLKSKNARVLMSTSGDSLIIAFERVEIENGDYTAEIREHDLHLPLPIYNAKQKK